MSITDTRRASIVRSDFARDPEGNFGSGGTLAATQGDTIELGFSDVVGIGKLGDLSIAVRGDSVTSDGVKDVVRFSGGHRLIGEMTLAAVLQASKSGRSTVDVTVIAPDGSVSGSVSVIVEVS